MASTHTIFRQRRAGVLLHPTSLPNAATDGALGIDSTRFLDFLAQSGFSIWQMLPVHATDQSGSPYQGTSLHAGDPRLISWQRLVDKGWLPGVPDGGTHQPAADITAIFRSARRGFQQQAPAAEQAAYQAFVREQSHWLDDYVLYSVIKFLHANAPWWQWPQPLRDRDAAALAGLRVKQDELLDICRFEQYVFFSQWQDLIKAAHERGVLLLGDMPILVAHDSVDVWARPEYFKLDATGQPVVVAGVPPDYFSATGQRWGNPLYEWRRCAADGYRWWVERLRAQLQLFDMVRIDHFRGFVGLWEIDASSPTAEQGHWQPVPGRELFNVLRAEFGELPLIAEDLGIISPEVDALRDDFGLPGMKVLLFAFDSDERNPYLPHNHIRNSVVYTGTHDNNTVLGWYYNLTEAQQQRVLDYLQYPQESMPWPLISTALQSVCRTAILPMQDLLGLDGSHRMNIPGTSTGNWLWRFSWEWLSPELPLKLRHLNKLYGRI
ncbi:MAG: 4-alpha-glucanotransferase [Gammaproteobacteria bacterium]|nr:4-alpha-glucanotransferase [Gammaproteobacteria bacterium]